MIIKHDSLCTRVMYGLVLIIIALFFTSARVSDGWSQGRSPQQLTFSISAQEGSCDRSVALYQGERITLKFPQKVQVSVPSQDQLVKLFISGRLVVISPLVQPQPHTQSTSGFPALSITTELVSGETFICRFEVLPRGHLLEGDKPVELIRIISAREERRQEDEAISLIQRRLKRLRQPQSEPRDTNDNYARLDRLLEHWQKQHSRDVIHQVFGASKLMLSSPTPLRAQENLIYITIERVMLSNEQAYLRVSLRNHSQERFNLHRVSYIPPDQSSSITLWTSSQVREGERISAPPNGQEQVLVLQGPINLLKSESLIFEEEGQRDVSINLSMMTEL